MHLIYIDDSYDRGYYCFSAIAIPAESWRETFAAIRNWRHNLKVSDGIYIRTELHSTDLVAGRGRIAPTAVHKWRRCEIYKSGLKILAGQNGVRIFNVCGSHNMARSYERLLNRINRTMQAWDSHAILICDEGDESTYTRLSRRLSAFNYIPSRFGAWPDGTGARNIPTERILEDPVFKNSSKSFLVQLADFCAFAILQKERPLASRKKYGLHRAYRLIREAFVLEANRADPDGIIR